ncbi:MAG TPA: hypothetical protein VD902_05505, partial [Symbiobacteriaceae bacterium]|nr:hypothetical protein [Symbiobacteriaceae bacterium]
CDGPEGTEPVRRTGDDPYGCLDVVLQALRDFPALGEDLLLRALRCREAGSRLEALWALADWPVEQVTGPLRAAVEACSECDPVERVRENALEVLSSWN